MEHKLIQGGEQFLPFARSRIKALKATGLKYASQKFEVDGVSIRVRIAGEHEYIELEGGASLFDMDSGVVELPEGNIYGTGILHYVGAANEYNAAFSVPDADGWLTHPEPFGQFSGQVTLKGPGKSEGRIWPDKSPAASYSPNDISDGLTPPSYTPNPADENLKGKRMSSGVASIYTGKCRLFVQAIKGTPTYERDKNGNVTSSNDYLRGSWLTPYIKPGPPPDPYPQDVFIYTASGVHLDPVTGKHWYFNPAEGHVMVYPLISSPAGERARRHLVPTKSKLNAIDREHLETYILARSRPDPSKAQRADVTLPSGIAMGYLWHWAWTNSVADMVVTDGVTVGGLPLMRSTHYRLQMSRSFVNDAPVWSAAVKVVEPAQNWQVNRTVWPIFEPLLGAMHKVTPPSVFLTGLINCDAPFYVFYLRDEIQVCRIKVNVIERREYREGTEYFSSPVFGSAIGFPGYTLGLNDGYTHDVVEDAYAAATVTCGAWNSGPAYMSRVIKRDGFKIFDKVANPLAAGALPHGTLSSDYLSPETSPGSSLNSGVPWGGPNAPQWQKQVTYQPYEIIGGTKSYRTSEYHTQFAHETRLVTIVPAGDAEALIVRRTDYQTDQKNNFDKKAVGGGMAAWSVAYALWTVGSTQGPMYGEVIGYIPWTLWNRHEDGYAVVFEDSTDIRNDTTTASNCVALGRAAGAEALLPDKDFHIGIDDYVYAQTFTTSGTSVTEPIVWSPDLPIQGVTTPGAPRVNAPDVPFLSIVGWV